MLGMFFLWNALNNADVNFYSRLMSCPYISCICNTVCYTTCDILCLCVELSWRKCRKQTTPNGKTGSHSEIPVWGTHKGGLLTFPVMAFCYACHGLKIHGHRLNPVKFKSTSPCPLMHLFESKYWYQFCLGSDHIPFEKEHIERGGEVPSWHYLVLTS